MANDPNQAEAYDPPATGSDKAGFWAQTDLLGPAADLLAFQQPTAPGDDAFVALDGNVLIMPYEAPRSLDDLQQIYSRLASANRLVVPGHALREFYLKRTEKMLEMGEKIASVPKAPSQDHLASNSRMLHENEDYSAALALYSKSHQAFAKELKEVANSLQKARERHDAIASGSDPLTAMYREVFSTSIFDPAWSDAERVSLEAEFVDRLSRRLPPGYKDNGKNGDFLIWKTVLKAAADRQTDCILVIEDTKPDWFVRRKEKAVSLRPELIAEYRRVSGGKSIFSLSLSEMVRKFKGLPAAIAEIESAEEMARAHIAFPAISISSDYAQLEDIDRQIAACESEIRRYQMSVNKSPVPPSGPLREQRLREDEQFGGFRDSMIEANERALAQLREARRALIDRLMR